MRFDVKRLVREPLFHFLVLGALLFVVYGLVNDDPRESELGTTIEIGAAEIDWLRGNWVRQWQRPPTDIELRNLIAEHIREEVLYREALAMGLDSDDVIVRRRLVQKLDFLSEDLTLQIPPTQAELEGFFRENEERFRIPARLTFTHIYFNGDARTDPRADAERTLTLLQTSDLAPGRVDGLGDRFMLQRDFASRSSREVSQDFGRGFGEALFALEPLAEWQGPIESAYGQHLVLISEREEGRVPTLAEVIDQVRAEYDFARREWANEAFYEALLARYEVSIDEEAIQSRIISAAGAAGGQ